MTLLDAPPPSTTTTRSAVAPGSHPTAPAGPRRAVVPDPDAVRRAAPRWAFIRPVAPIDTDALIAFGRRCSPESLLHRFLSPMTGLPTAHVEDVVAGRGDMVSMVAVTPDGSIVGLATLAPSRSGPPELAVLVEDRWQRQGVGWGLVLDLVGSTRALGHQQFVVVLASTRPWLLRWLSPLGPFRHELDGPIIEATFELV